MSQQRRDSQSPPHQRRPDAQGGDRSDVDRETGEIRSRPWSEDEVVMEMQRVLRTIDDDVALLKSLGAKKAQSQSALDRERARQLLIVKTTRKDMSSDKLREAWIIDQTMDDGETSVADLMLAAELDATLYWDSAATLKARQAQADILRSMLRSVRDATESWGENRGRDGRG